MVVGSNMSSMPAAARPDRLVTAPFVVVTAATFAFFVFVGMVAPVLPVFIEDELGGNGTAIGIAIAVFAVAAIAVRPVIGRIGDTAGRRTLMVGGSLTTAVAVAATAWVSEYMWLLPLRALSGVGEAALFVGAATLIADLSPPHRRAEGASYFSVAVFGGIGIGPILGETVLAGDHFARTFLTAALFCLVAAALSLFTPVRIAGTERRVSAPGAKAFHRAAFAPGIVLACGIAGIAAFTAFVPTYVDELGLSGASGVFALYSVITLVIRLFLAKLPERMGLTRAVAGALSALSAGLAVMALVESIGGLYAGTVLVSLGIALLYPALMASAVNGVPADERTSVLSTFTMFFEVGTILGGLVLGPVVASSGERAAFLGGSLFALAGLGVLFAWVAPHLRARPSMFVPDDVPIPSVAPLPAE